ncbi:MAG: hypothetical protein NE330_05245, partial [Lentisphaeraceae bacterium]|nr:hypothetical protein [Lentisphaeraceae bacterium]
MNTSLIFSLSQVSDSVFYESLDFISLSAFERFELSGALVENENFSNARDVFFKNDKNILSIQDFLPSNLSRNIADSSEDIQKKLISFVNERLAIVSKENIEYIELDLAVDAIKTGQEIQEISKRALVLSQLMKSASKSGITALIPLRFPKEFPKSLSWRYITMLVNQVLHQSTRTVINVFPHEAKPQQMENILKKTFYSSSAIRFCYEPEVNGYLSREYFQGWLQVLCNQGFTGDIILAPKILN